MPKVLIIDDDYGPRESLRMVLKNDHEVLTAEHVDAGVALLKAQQPDVVVMDIRMPGKTGIDGLREIRAIDRTVSVIMLTGYGALETAQEAIRLGANDYMKKPFDLAEIQEVVNRHAQRTRVERRKSRALSDLQNLNTRLQEEMMLKERLANVGEASAEFAHDLRNPLGIVMGYCELLVDQVRALQAGREEAYQDTLEYVQVIEENVKRCSALADMWQKAGGEEASRDRARIELNAMINEIVESVRPLTQLQPHPVDYAVEAEPVAVLGERSQLLRAIHNLITNALHALPEEGGRIRIVCSREGEQARLVVSDNGCGIPAHLLEKVFEQRYTTKPPHQGTGLGLSITRKIVEDHGGSVSLLSEEGKGTDVHICLPTVD